MGCYARLRNGTVVGPFHHRHMCYTAEGEPDRAWSEAGTVLGSTPDDPLTVARVYDAAVVRAALAAHEGADDA